MDDPAQRVRLEVRHADAKRPGRWSSGWVRTTAAEAPGSFDVANPGQPSLPSEQRLRWRVRARKRGEGTSPWSPWTEFRISDAAPSVEPRIHGTVRRLGAKPLKAEVRRPRDARSIAGYEIELAERRANGAVDWASPLWTAAGGPLVAVPAPVGGEKEIAFEALEGRRPRPGIVVDQRRPVVRVRSVRPIASYTWTLTQHGDVIRRRREITTGLSDDRLCVSLRLPAVASRGPGYFAPPFARSKGRYRGETYKPGNASNPAGHSAYAVDCNRGSDDDDAGDPVLACAKGRVVGLDQRFGTVTILHYGGAFRTEYAHLRSPFEVRDGQEVDALERIGSISNTGVSAVHLHHRHYVKLTRGPFKGMYKPTKMRFGGRAVRASRAGPDVHQHPWEDWKSDWEGFEPGGFLGWTNFDPEAAVTVRATFDDGSRSKPIRLRFFVDRRSRSDAGIVDAGCKGSGLAEAESFEISHRYDGPALPSGTYALRYRARDDRGVTGPWAIDDSLTIES